MSMKDDIKTLFDKVTPRMMACTMCGTSEFAFNTKRRRILGMKVYVAVCTGCGHVLFFSATGTPP